jgi:hypothetical protein
MAQWHDVAVPAGVPGLPSGRQELHCWMFNAFRLDQRGGDGLLAAAGRSGAGADGSTITNGRGFW